MILDISDGPGMSLCLIRGDFYIIGTQNFLKTIFFLEVEGNSLFPKKYERKFCFWFSHVLSSLLLQLQ